MQGGHMKIHLAAVVGAAFLFGGCAMMGAAKEKPNMTVSQELPAAEGTADFARTKNENTSIEVKVKHLASPEKLDPPAVTYVVWVRQDGEERPQNVGALKVDDNLTGTLATVTPLRRFELFITAEDDGQAREPSGEPLLWTSHNG